MQHVEILLQKVNFSTFWYFSHRQQPDSLKTGLNVGGKKAFCSNVAKQFARFSCSFYRSFIFYMVDGRKLETESCFQL